LTKQRKGQLFTCSNEAAARAITKS
jgi:hypothetical protein